MEKDTSKPILKFEPGSRQPFILYLISITIISTIIVIVCLFTSGMSFAEAEAKTPGDINLDGTVDSKDVLLLTQYLAGNTKFKEPQLTAADVDENGEVNSKDSMLLIQLLGQSPGATPAPSTTKPPNEPSTSENSSQDTITGEESVFEESTSSPEISIDFELSGKSDNMAFLTGENGVYYTARIVNHWTSADGKYMYQVEFTVKNNSSKTVFNTSADINLNSSADVEKSWDCSVSGKDNKITIRTQNPGRIKEGGTFSCGFIISAGYPISIDSVTK